MASSDDMILIVLYSDMETGKQSWCGYFGGTSEADKEGKLMVSQNPNLMEKGRFWAVEKTTYCPLPEKKAKA